MTQESTVDTSTHATQIDNIYASNQHMIDTIGPVNLRIALNNYFQNSKDNLSDKYTQLWPIIVVPDKNTIINGITLVANNDLNKHKLPLCVVYENKVIAAYNVHYWKGAENSPAREKKIYVKGKMTNEELTKLRSPLTIGSTFTTNNQRRTKQEPTLQTIKVLPQGIATCRNKIIATWDEDKKIWNS